MLKKIQTLRDFVLDFLFPPRTQETLVASLTISDILTFPKASAYIPHVYSLFSYKDPRVKALIWELKYYKNHKSMKLVGQLLAEYLIEELSDRALFENTDTILLVPIPQAKKQFRERGFSQTALLCEEIKKHVPDTIVYAPDALQKIKETKRQNKTKSRLERLKNLEGAFKASEHVVAGRHVILIDDVVTTGATIREAIKALKDAHVKHVTAFTIAH